jgi:ribosomal RNA assembly protein
MNEDIHEEKFYLEKDRISVFIGKEGSMKKKISEYFNAEIDVDSKNGEVLVESQNAVDAFVLAQVVQAINYGHNPENTLKLEDENMVFDILDVKQMVKDHLRLKVVMGRIIGKEGSTRKAIEEITKCHIAVKDHYVTIIGAFENVGLVHEALDMLIKGGSHKSFYGYLERNKVNTDNDLI